MANTGDSAAKMLAHLERALEHAQLAVEETRAAIAECQRSIAANPQDPPSSGSGS